MVHMCECGLATSDLTFLKGDLTRSGHHERALVALGGHRQIGNSNESRRYFVISDGNSFGSSAASVSGEEGNERPGNSWLFRVCGVQKMGNAL
jgi:hypothetical protein